MDERNHGMESTDWLQGLERTNSLDELLAKPFSSPAEPRLKEEEKPARALDALKPEHREKALALAKQIDPANHQAVLQYGVAAQAELSKFSHAILHHVQTKDAGPVGEVISELMAKIKEVNPDDLMPAKKGWLSRLFGAVAKPLQEMVAKYQKIGVEIDKIADRLEKHRHLLLRDIMMLETLYEKTKTILKRSIFILRQRNTNSKSCGRRRFQKSKRKRSAPATKWHGRMYRICGSLPSGLRSGCMT